MVFTGVFGSGKSGIVFDTVAAESCRQMNETYPAWVRGRLPKYEKPRADRIENLTASVIVDQSRPGGNARSTVGTVSGLYPILRVLFSVIGVPHVGPASFFSFNDPNGMCRRCSGLGKIMELDLEGRIVLEEKYRGGLEGLEGFSHLQVLWWFSGCDCAEDRSIPVREKPYTKGPDRIGTFAARAPQRPNPIALPVCRVKGPDPEKGVILPDYFDALTGTPIPDIKPYTPSLDRVEEPIVPEWCAHWPKNVETGGDFAWEKEFNFPE